MRLLLLAVLLSGAVALSPEQCEQVLGDELQYKCRLSNATVVLTAKNNDYVKILCEGTDFSCSEIPYFDFANSLPLKSLGVTSCPPSILGCVNEHISATSLEIVTLDNMAGPLTREDLVKLGDVRVLMVRQAGAETSFPVATFTAYPTLRRLNIGGGNFQLSSNIFENAPPLKYLELSNDHMHTIPPDSFKGLQVLNELNLWRNPIENITVGAFRGLDALEKLTLTSNNLSSMEPGAFSDIPKLKSLYMMANRLAVLPNGLLGGLEHLENITIQMNQVELSLASEAFARLPSLKNIIITYTKLRHLSANLFNGTNGILSIQWNRDQIESLSADIFLRLSELKRLDLSNNKIQVLPKGIFRGLKKLEYLNMNTNSIEALPEGLFDGTSRLKEIHLDFNSIATIAPSSFGGARNLRTLSLSSNKLTLDPVFSLYQFIDDSYISPFNALVKLVKLDLSHNKIQTIFYDWQTVLLQLEYLDLSYNHFKVIEFDHNAMKFLSSKLTVDLRHNRISVVHLDRPLSPIGETQTATTLLLDDNPIVCNCFMYGLRLRLNGTRYAYNEPKFSLNNVRCSSPPELQGELFKQVPPEHLVCKVPELLPESCTSCIAKVASNELVLDCRNFPKLPDPKSPNVTLYFIQEPTITLNLKQQPENLSGQNVHTLNLSHAGIDHLDFKLSEGLKVLDLSHNELASVPMEFLQSNITLYLSANPFECECWYADNIAAIQRYGYIADFAQMTCANGDKIALLDATALCNTWKASMAALGTFVVLAACVLITGIIIYRYSNEILVYMTTRGICKCCVKEVLLDKDKEFDVFISFAHQDLSLVQDNLLPMLENDFNQKVCVHYRDWIVGDMIPTQIIRSVENSKRTVIVLSKHFLESMWANLEFCAAHNLALQEGKARVILILLEESVAKHSSLSEELRAYIATNTYLLWGDPKFWEKLRKVLPRKKHTFTWIDGLKQRSHGEEKEGIVGLDVQLNSDGQLVNVARKIVNDTKPLPHPFV